jgi:hypothetical protein
MDNQPDQNYACPGNWHLCIVPGISATKALKVPEPAKYPKKTRYDCLETDEFWTYVGKKKNKVWLIYACHREIGEIIAYVWEKGA